MIYGFINGQDLKIKAPKVVADTIDYLEAEFKFETTDWDGLQKFAHFESKENNHVIALTDDRIRKEDHLNLSEGSWRVWLHGDRIDGEKVGERITTDAAKILVAKSGVIDGEPFPEITPSIAEQVLANAQLAVEIANSVRKDADEGKFDGTGAIDREELFYSPSGILNGVIGNISANPQKYDYFEVTAGSPNYTFIVFPDYSGTDVKISGGGNYTAGGGEVRNITIAISVSPQNAWTLNACYDMYYLKSGLPELTRNNEELYRIVGVSQSVASGEGGGGNVPSMDDIVDAVLDALPTWDGGAY